MVDADALRRATRTLSQHRLIVTDLDGTLLDHYSYSHAPVDAVLAQLDQRDVPVIFNTSKTFAEVQTLRKELDNRHPFVVENGSAIYIPDNYFSAQDVSEIQAPGHQVRGKTGDAQAHEGYYCIALGQPVAAIHQWLAAIRDDPAMDFASFAEMTADEIAQATGLSLEQAAKAAQREFSEAIQWRGSAAQKTRFCAAAQAAGFSVLQGGRFTHLLGQCDKGRATLRLASEYTEQHARQYSVIAAGDGLNDVDMLAIADLAILVRSPVHDFPKLPAGTTAVHTDGYGPTGWAEVVEFLLAQTAST